MPRGPRLVLIASATAAVQKHNNTLFQIQLIKSLARHELIILSRYPIILFFNSPELYLLFSQLHPIILKIFTSMEWQQWSPGFKSYRYITAHSIVLECSAEVSGFMTLEEVYMMSGGHWFTYTSWLVSRSRSPWLNVMVGIYWRSGCRCLPFAAVMLLRRISVGFSLSLNTPLPLELPPFIAILPTTRGEQLVYTCMYAPLTEHAQYTSRARAAIQVHWSRAPDELLSLAYGLGA